MASTVSLRCFFSNNRGIALILTIMAISIIVALSVQFNRKMRDQLFATATVDQGLKALYMANSGIAYGMALLAVDDAKSDALTDQWSSDNESPVPQQLSIGSQALFSSGSFSIRIEDLSSRIPINLVDKTESDKVFSKIFRRLLENEAFELEAERVNEIVDSVIDWIDPGLDEGGTLPSGAEWDYYQSLEPPYYCKDGALDSLEELLLIKGMTPELFGTDDAKESPSLRRYLTVYGDTDAKININTADKLVLQALDDDMTQGMAEDMDAYRKETDSLLLENANWCNDAGVPKDIYERIKKTITTKSTYFKITATGRYGQVSSSPEDKSRAVERTVVVVVRRKEEDKDGQITLDVLSRQID